MRNDAIFALARDTNLRIRRVLEIGKRLQKDRMGLEDHSVIGFCALADDLLQDFKVSTESFESDPIQDRIVSLEGVLDSIKGLFRAKHAEHQQDRENKEESEPYIWELGDWVTETLQAATGETARSSIEISPKYGAFFTPGWHQALGHDLHQYRALYAQIKPAITTTDRYLSKVSKTLEHFKGDTDHLEEFTKAFQGLVKAQPSTVVSTFREPTGAFLGFGKRPFVEDGVFVDDTAGAPRRTATVAALSPKEFIKFRDQLMELYLLALDIDGWQSELHLGLDYSDPPFRGYAGEAAVDELTNTAMFLHPHYEETCTDIAHTLSDRIQELTLAMFHYARRHIG